MPYKVEEKDGKWCVVNSNTDRVVAEHDTEEAAERQRKLLEKLEEKGE